MITKLCIKCRIEKPHSEFSTHRSKKDGLQTSCKECMSAYRAANKAKIAARHTEWRAKNAESLRIYQARIYAENADSRKKKVAEYRAKNGDACKARSAKWRSENADLHRKRSLAWQAANPDKANARKARYRSAMLMATPAWSDPAKILEIYAQAMRLTRETGVEHHVDHIVPLRSKIVCGLHVEANLRAIPGADNCSKQNRYWPDMP